jgi:hypothetical protein
MVERLEWEVQRRALQVSRELVAGGSKCGNEVVTGVKRCR